MGRVGLDPMTGGYDAETLRPAVIAGHLLRDAGKYHDDASVLAAKGLW